MKSIDRRALVSSCAAIISASIFPKLAYAAPAYTSPTIAQSNSGLIQMTQGERRTTSSDNPYIIPNPSLAFVNLLGERGKILMAADRAALGDTFGNNIQIAERTLPRCNVLFLYGDLEPSGRIANTSLSFREVIKGAGAHVAVIASEIQPALLSNSEFTKSLSAKHDWPANIVIALNRNGEHFGRFFHQLFSRMKAGVSMPMAWVELAPQGPHQPKDIPGTIALMEAGHIAFGRKGASSSDFRVTIAEKF